MNAPAAIQAQLVDVRNLGTEKCVKLTLHAPVEIAAQIFEAFGWPTAVNPVPVALARLDLNAAERSADRRGAATTADSTRLPSPALKQPRPFTSLPLAQQAALLCQDPVFRAFVREELDMPCETEADAADVIRMRCAVDSRSEIASHPQAKAQFIMDRERFQAWKLVSA